jgi:hypothetical protein
MAQPLINRGQMSDSQLFRRYADILVEDVEENNQSNFYLFLGFLSDQKSVFESRYHSLISKYPKLSAYIPLFNWLCHIYKPTGEPSFFDFVRSDDAEGFLKSLSSKSWKTVSFGGAFSSSSYPQWRAAALDLLKLNGIEKEERRILSVLVGDRHTLREFEKTWFDRLWGDLFHFFCKARCQYSELNFSWDSNSPFEKGVLSVLDHGPSAVSKVRGLPLSLKIHVSAIIREIESDLIQQYLEILLDAGLLGLVVFYGSLAGEEAGNALLARVLVGLPKADKRAIELATQFGLSPSVLASQITETMIHSGNCDFETVLSADELRTRRIASIGWLMLVPDAKDVRNAKIRELVKVMIMEEDLVGAREVFSGFIDAWADGDYIKERKCWNLLLEGESEYNKWKIEGKNGPEAKRKLNAILRYPSGWMRECVGVGSEVGKKWIPLVTKQLHAVLMRMKENDQALGIAAIICDSGRLLEEYFSREDMKVFLTDYLKKSAVAGLAVEEDE